MTMAIVLVSFLVFFSNLALTTPQPIDGSENYVFHYCLYHTGNYTKNSDYAVNLNRVLSMLPVGDGNGYGFYNLSSGGDGDRDKAYAIGQCRGDAKPEVCQNCLTNATHLLPQICTNQKDAGVWYRYCMLRYSNRSMAGGAAISPTTFFMSNAQSILSDPDRFKQDLGDLLTSLKNRAASSLRKFATGNKTTSVFTSIYALVQCTADLSEQDCNNCLDEAFGKITTCCDGKIGGRVIQSNCNFRYETYVFYGPVDDMQLPMSPSAPPPEESPLPPPPLATQERLAGRESKKSRTVLIVGLASAFASAVLTSLVFVCLRITMKNMKAKTFRSNERVEETETSESLQYSFKTIRVATDNFSDANKLGRSRFGQVYKGRLSNGNFIAVKRFSRSSVQGDLEFKNEIIFGAKLHHRNLVTLLGFCKQGRERLLVYELVPKGSLDQFIFDPIKRANLDWDSRYKIIQGVARGLLYLHEDSCLRIIHRDLNVTRILLDEEMNPKISNFGTARLLSGNQTQDTTSRIVGTYGYMAPEYALHGHYSMKSDVFSFGVLLLEIVSGQKINSFHISSVWKNWEDGTTSNIVDPLARHGSGFEITRFIHIALLCIQENFMNRPTMDTVVLMLNNNTISLQLPSEPAFLERSNTSGST